MAELAVRDVRASVEKMILPERFWEKVNRTDTCWLWTGATTDHGYGSAWVEGRSVVAHRASYEALVGPIPGGLALDHLCRVRHCVNPAHLEPVTWKENIHRSPFSEHKRTHCPRGHPYSGANLRSDPNKPKRECRTCNRERCRAWRLARSGV